MAKEKSVLYLTDEETENLKEALGKVLEIYGKGNSNVKDEGLRILEGWGRIVFIVSNDGRRIGLELTERWERERATD